MHCKTCGHYSHVMLGDCAKWECKCTTFVKCECGESGSHKKGVKK